MRDALVYGWTRSGEVELDEFEVVDGGGGLAAGDAIEGAAAAEEKGEEDGSGEHDGDEGEDAEDELGGFLDGGLHGLLAVGGFGGHLGFVVDGGEKAVSVVLDGVATDDGEEGAGALDLDGFGVGVEEGLGEGALGGVAGF